MKHGNIVTLFESLMGMSRIPYINILQVQLEFLDSNPWLEIVNFVLTPEKH